MKNYLILIASGLWLAGCAGTYSQSGANEPGKGHEPAGERKPSLDISKAGMPFKILRARGGQEITGDEFFAELSAAAAVCVGESHNNPHHHWAQLHLVEALAKRPGDRVMALGMEMFQRPFQGVLDDYAAGRIDEQALLTRTGWAERWGFDFAFYRPIVNAAVAGRMAILALNTTNELRKKLAGAGLDGLTDEERAQVPELNLDDPQHRAWFEDIMASMHGGHGHPVAAPQNQAAEPGESHDQGKHAESRAHDPGEAAEHSGADDPHHAHQAAPRPHGAGIYLTQVLWDETMAETAANWLAAGSGHQVIILAGTGHCHDSAIVRRMQRRGIDRVVSVRPLIDDGNGNIAGELAQPMNDYLFVMSPR